MTLSTHVLDTARGEPAPGVPVTLQRHDDDAWTTVASGRTDGDGRLRDWVPVVDWGAGLYRLTFDLAEYLGAGAFFPEATVVFRVTAPERHHHIPLLLSPFGYSTYRGELSGVGITLGANRYGKAEIRLVRVVRDGPVHDLRDLTVSVALAGDLTATHLRGDNAHVLPTDTQKNTVYAFAKEFGVGEIEDFALRLARHFVASQPAIARARVAVAEHGWRRLGPHSFQHADGETRTALVTVDGADARVVSGVAGLVLLNTTDSEFAGFATDRYTTLAEAADRILATEVTARWRHAVPAGDWRESFEAARNLLVAAFADTYSRSLQQTLYAMGHRVLEHRPELVEVRLSLPNRHHVAVDLTPFGLANPGEVFHADDRPYGLIEGVVQRDDAPPAGPAWDESWSS